MPQNLGLGKGLSSLISNETISNVGQAYIPDLPINKIIPNQFQPRVEIDPTKLIELADSIREYGVIEPLIVNQRNSDEYELIAGERRWRAAKIAGIKNVPVVLKDASPQQMLELAIVENVQREDLNPLEEAMAFEHLAKRFGLSHGEIAQKMGYSRPAVANKIRLLALSDEIKKELITGNITEGHARALLGLKDENTMEATLKIIIRDGLSVRATEKLVQRLNIGTKKTTKQQKLKLNSKLISVEKSLSTKLNVKVALSTKAKGGKIIIPFKDENELDKITSIFEQI